MAKRIEILNCSKSCYALNFTNSPKARYAFEGKLIYIIKKMCKDIYCKYGKFGMMKGKRKKVYIRMQKMSKALRS